MGNVSYEASKTPVLTGTGNSHTFDTVTTNRTTGCLGDGSTNADSYYETGVIKRNSRPLFTALDGTIYYEVITWSV